MAYKIVITGATGFAGRNILESFEETKEVFPACRNKSKLPKRYKDNALIGDLSKHSYIETLTKKADVLCHSAAWAEMNGTNEDSKKYFLNPTIDLIDTALKNGVKRFIFLSSITSKPIEKNRIHTTLSLDKIWAHYNSIIQIEKYLEKVSHKGMEVVILRVGFFTGKNYALGLLPILLPRLKTHLVPWIEKGETALPLIDGNDIGLAFKLSVLSTLKEQFNVIDIVGKEVPKVKEVFNYLHDRHGYPLPHFSVSFTIAYLFARFMRFVYKIFPSDPLIVPAIVLLLEETHANNEKAEKILNYKPQIHWKYSIDMQIEEMNIRQTTNMKMNKANDILPS